MIWKYVNIWRRSTMYHGRDTIAWIAEKLQIDEKWMVKKDSGFTWWSHRFAQNIGMAGVVQGPDGKGDEGYMIVVKTDFLRQVELNDRGYRVLNSFMKDVSLAAPVYDRTKKTISLVSQLSVHDGVQGWMQPILVIASLLHLIEAEAFGEQLANELECEVNASGHPTHGSKEKADDIFTLAQEDFFLQGRGPARWTEEEFTDAVMRYMQQPPSLGATNGGKGLTAEFPHGHDTSLFQMNCDEKHPFYGSGLLLTQKFRYSPSSETEGYRKALEFNSTVVEQNQSAYGLGSFCYQDGILAYSAFFPNVLYNGPGLLPNFYYTSAGRAHLVSQLMGNPPWTAADFQKKENAIERFFRRMRER